jgi:hypothetical protein
MPEPNSSAFEGIRRRPVEEEQEKRDIEALGKEARCAMAHHSDFEHLLEVSQVPRGSGSDKRHIFEPHSTQFGII